MAHTPTGEEWQGQQGDWPSQTARENTGRVWRACLECRKKKSKCDGRDICRPCELKNRECIYPPSNDNASTSRQMLTSVEAQCKHMKSLCQRMETFMDRFNSMFEILDKIDQVAKVSGLCASTSTDGNDASLTKTVHTNDESIQPDTAKPCETASNQRPETSQTRQDNECLDEVADFDSRWRKAMEKRDVDYVMTTDSYGKLRFVGGTSTMMMIEAMKSLSQSFNGQVHSPSGSNSSEQQSPSVLELPFFSRGATWPRLPCLPHPKQLTRPPKYVADLLIDLYFSKLHYTMPILYKPHFVQRYNLLMETSKRPELEIDSGFLAVLFAVWACASALLPRDPGGSDSFTGFQYYENAIMLHYASTGEGSIEQVQTLALLSMCSAGWNTLAQSWKFAGQAVRAAQDLGLHRSPARGAGEKLKEELCRRVWWSIYDLDRVLSFCLGRPMAVDDDECDTEMPLDLDDIELEAYGRGESIPSTESPSRLSGFIACSYLCQISYKVARSVSSLHLNRIRQETAPGRIQKLKRRVEGLDQELADWLQQIPDSLKFSPNKSNVDNPHLTMCVISYIVHAGCTINLHWPLMSESSDNAGPPVDDSSYQKCMNAARSCIQVAELVQECVLPSHYHAFCTHYLALSGVFLLRNAPTPMSRTLSTEIESCICYLKNLETVWTGARRSRFILEELFNLKKSSGRMQKKRTFGQMMGNHDPHAHRTITGEGLHNNSTLSNHLLMDPTEREDGVGVLGEFDIIASMDSMLGHDLFADFF